MLGSKTIIILSSGEAIKEILDNRSGVSSDRMDLYMGQTLASGGLRVLLMVIKTSIQSLRNRRYLLCFPALWTFLEDGRYFLGAKRFPSF